MGKSCVRFKKVEDVPLKVIGDTIKRVPVKKFIERYESLIHSAGRAASKASARNRGATATTGKAVRKSRSKRTRKTAPKAVAKRKK